MSVSRALGPGFRTFPKLEDLAGPRLYVFSVFILRLFLAFVNCFPYCDPYCEWQLLCHVYCLGTSPAF